MRDQPIRSRRSRLLLPVLALLLAASTGLVVYTAIAAQATEEVSVQGVLNLRATTARRARAALTRRGVLIAAPSTPREARSMVHFCDRAAAPDVSALRDTALRAADPLAAANAVRALGRLGAVAGDAELVALLRDPRERVRDETILALGEGGSETSVAHLRPLVRSEDPKVRTLAIRALGRSGGESAKAALHDVLSNAATTREERAFAVAGVASGNR